MGKDTTGDRIFFNRAYYMRKDDTEVLYWPSTFHWQEYIAYGQKKQAKKWDQVMIDVDIMLKENKQESDILFKLTEGMCVY